MPELDQLRLYLNELSLFQQYVIPVPLQRIKGKEPCDNGALLLAALESVRYPRRRFFQGLMDFYETELFQTSLWFYEIGLFSPGLITHPGRKVIQDLIMDLKTTGVIMYPWDTYALFIKLIDIDDLEPFVRSFKVLKANHLVTKEWVQTLLRHHDLSTFARSLDLLHEGGLLTKPDMAQAYLGSILRHAKPCLIARGLYEMKMAGLLDGAQVHSNYRALFMHKNPIVFVRDLIRLNICKPFPQLEDKQPLFEELLVKVAVHPSSAKQSTLAAEKVRGFYDSLGKCTWGLFSFHLEKQSSREAERTASLLMK